MEFLRTKHQKTTNRITSRSALLQELIPALSKPEEQEHANRWLTRLSDLTLNVKNLRDKRNRFLMMLSICLLSGHLHAPFDVAPPAKLPEISTIRKPKFSPAEWTQAAGEWKEHLTLANELLKKLKLPPVRKCHVHQKQCSGGRDARGTVSNRSEALSTITDLCVSSVSRSPV